ncbi:MAG: hypothetical protein WCJ64_01745 [Rhodospirillaceae bacterium]
MVESLRWTPKISELRRRVMAAMSYLGILCFIPLHFCPDDGFVNFHARQGAVIWIWTAISLVAFAVPGMRWLFSISIVLIVAVSFIGILSALLLKSWRFPVIGNLAKRL